MRTVEHRLIARTLLPTAGTISRSLAVLLVAAAASPASAQLATLTSSVTDSTSLTTAESALHKIGPLAQRRIPDWTGRSRVIVSAVNGASPAAIVPAIMAAGGTLRRALPLINAQVVDLPNVALAALAGHSLVGRVSLDRSIIGSMERTGATIGSTDVRQNFGYDGAGIGVAIIDSGAAPWLDDLSAAGGGSRVRRFVDFVNGRTDAHDDYGHGTHVAGIVAGNGFDSSGARSGIAPAADLIVLKVLDAAGNGRISDVIAALDYIVANKDALNIRVANLSIATGVYESYETDPLTVAAKRAVEAGIVVVAAAGNRGRNANGQDAYGGVTAPGNAPWVLTVGASSHMGTVDRADDVMARFSSRGPTAVDYAAKPDVVAPGVGIESLSDPDSSLYTTRSAYLLNGTVATSYLPYLSLSGTSMAAPVVTGTVALMLQANPTLTPNLVKAILEYTAQTYASYDPLTEGAGFLNARGAVELARFFAEPAGTVHPISPEWSTRIVWGNQMMSGGRLTGDANAWPAHVTWGAATADGQTSSLGFICFLACDATGNGGIWRRWDALLTQNVVWGSMCAGADCQGPWTVEAADDDDSVVWGTDDPDSVVWGTSDEDDSVVWGTSCGDPDCEPVLWSAP